MADRDMECFTSPSLTPVMVNAILADIAAIVPQFSAIVSSYRLLVGAAEEISRTPGTTPDTRQRAIARFDRTGDIIDMLIDLLCCKVAFSTQLLEATCAPVDLLRALLCASLHRCYPTETTTPTPPPSTPTQVVHNELVRQLLHQLTQEKENAAQATNRPAQSCGGSGQAPISSL